MDTSFLKTLNQTLSLVETKSLFYKKYLYRLKIKAPGIRQHIYYKGDFNKYIAKPSYIGLYNRLGIVEPVVTGLNNCLYKMIINKPIKYRIEHPYFNIYTETQEEIIDILSDIEKSGYTEKLIELSAPDPIAIKHLTDNVILVKRIPAQFKFKVTIKGGRKTQEYIESRQNLFNHLYNLGDAVYRHNLEAINTYYQYYFNSTYFYCTDEQTLLLLQLAYPEIIGKTFKVVQV